MMTKEVLHMSKERELLKKIWEDLDGDRDNYNLLCEEIEELLAQPEHPPMTQREMYQRGYAAAERDLKREPLSDEWIKDNIGFIHRDVSFTDLVRGVEKAHGIGGEK